MSIRDGSGGNGKFTGGDGITRRLRFLEQLTVTTLCSHRRVSPKGLHGGKDGEVGREWIERQNGSIDRHKANDINEYYVQAIHNIGLCYEIKKDFDMAKSYYKKAIEYASNKLKKMHEIIGFL